MNLSEDTVKDLKRLRLGIKWLIDMHQNGMHEQPGYTYEELTPYITHEHTYSADELGRLISNLNTVVGKEVVTESFNTIIPVTEDQRLDNLSNQLTTVTNSAQTIKSDLAVRYNESGVLTFPSVHLFNGGEVNLKLEKSDLSVWDVTTVSVYARIQDSNGLVGLMLLKDALERALGAYNEVIYSLYLDYVPYARQDRVCNPGEALSISVIAGMVNELNFDRITITDPHSDVSSALFNKVVVISCADILTSFPEIMGEVANGHIDALVAPDAGSIKKVDECAKHLNLGVVQAGKKRDVATGNLSGFTCEADVKGMNLLIVDDICDGGGTFVGLGNLLREKGALHLSLYVTHGIFSKGIDDLLKVYDTIYTTDSFKAQEINSRLIVKKLFGE